MNTTKKIASYALSTALNIAQADNMYTIPFYQRIIMIYRRVALLFVPWYSILVSGFLNGKCSRTSLGKRYSVISYKEMYIFRSQFKITKKMLCKDIPHRKVASNTKSFLHHTNKRIQKTFYVHFNEIFSMQHNRINFESYYAIRFQSF